MMNKLSALGAALALTILPVSGASAANLLVNGDFEASTSQTATPPGWTNIGHTDGVIAYSLFATPAFDGLYYYDIGGFGGALPAPGDGIMQTVATTAGSSYVLSFGYSSEAAGGQTFLDVYIGTQLTQIDLVPAVGFILNKPFTAFSINYVATGATTDIKFLVSPASASFGNNDPMIDGVVFSASSTGPVPEPATWAMMIAGFGIAGAALRRRAVVAFG